MFFVTMDIEFLGHTLLKFCGIWSFHGLTQIQNVWVIGSSLGRKRVLVGHWVIIVHKYRLIDLHHIRFNRIS